MPLAALRTLLLTLAVVAFGAGHVACACEATAQAALHAEKAGVSGERHGHMSAEMSPAHCDDQPEPAHDRDHACMHCEGGALLAADAVDIAPPAIATLAGLVASDGRREIACEYWSDVRLPGGLRAQGPPPDTPVILRTRLLI